MLNYVNNKFGKIHLAKFKCSIIFKKHVVKYVIGFWGAKFIYKSKVAFIDHHQQNINKHTKKRKKKEIILVYHASFTPFIFSYFYFNLGFLG